MSVKPQMRNVEHRIYTVSDYLRLPVLEIALMTGMAQKWSFKAMKFAEGYSALCTSTYPVWRFPEARLPDDHQMAVISVQ